MRAKHPDEEKPTGEDSDIVEEHKKDDLEVVAGKKTTLEEDVSENVTEEVHEEEGTKKDKQKEYEEDENGETSPGSQLERISNHKTHAILNAGPLVSHLLVIIDLPFKIKPINYLTSSGF